MGRFKGESTVSNIHYKVILYIHKTYAGLGRVLNVDFLSHLDSMKQKEIFRESCDKIIFLQTK